MELIMKTDLTVLPKVIEYNHEELKKQLTVELEKYQNIVVTENDISNAKADRANLNKFKEALENKRKSVKKEYLAPYEGFEKKIKEIIGMVDVPVKAIDSQIKSFEDLKKEEKKKEIERMYLDEIGELKKLIPLEKLWNPKWLNATYKLSNIGIELETTIGNLKSGLQIIKDLHCTFEDQVMDRFLETLDISAALAENKRLEIQKKQLEALKKQQEEKQLEMMKKQQEEKQLETIKTKLEEEQIENKKDSQVQDDISLKRESEKLIPSTEQKYTCLDFRIWVTTGQLALLKQFLIDNEIKYGKVPQTV